MNDTNAIFSSLWDIDQIYLQGEVTTTLLNTTGGSQTTFTMVTHNLGFSPVSEVQIQAVGDTVWQQVGEFIPSGTGYTQIGFTFGSPNSNTLNLVYNYTSAISVNIRYFIWADRLDY